MKKIYTLLSLLFISLGTANASTYNVNASLFILDPTGTLVQTYNYGGIFDDSNLNNNTQQGVTNLTLSTICFFGPEPCPPSFTNIEVYEPGNYEDFSISTGEYGVKMLFSWDTVYQDLPLINIWSVVENSNNTLSFASLDSDGDGIQGQALTSGPFPGFNLGFNMSLTPTPVPLPGAFILFISGIFTLFCFTKKTIA